MNCRIDPELWGPDVAPLFPAQQQHWVIAFPPSRMPTEVLVRLFRAKLQQLGIDTDGWQITGEQVDRPSTISGRQVVRAGSHLAIPQDTLLPPGTRYVAVAWDLPGDAPRTVEWVWPYTDCPEQLEPTGGLWAVYRPAQTVIPDDSSPLLDTADELVGEAGEVVRGAGEAADAIPDLAKTVAVGATALAGLAWLLTRRK